MYPSCKSLVNAATQASLAKVSSVQWRHLVGQITCWLLTTATATRRRKVVVDGGRNDNRGGRIAAQPGTVDSKWLCHAISRQF